MAYLEIIYPSPDALQSKDLPESVVLHLDDTCQIDNESIPEEINRMDAEGIYDYEWKDGLVCFPVKDCPICKRGENHEQIPTMLGQDNPIFLFPPDV